ncbi:MAG: hypothetical protein ACFCBW_03985, partial [Candidatus Competibacterales bacterium]
MSSGPPVNAPMDDPSAHWRCAWETFVAAFEAIEDRPTAKAAEESVATCLTLIYRQLIPDLGGAPSVALADVEALLARLEERVLRQPRGQAALGLLARRQQQHDVLLPLILACLKKPHQPLRMALLQLEQLHGDLAFDVELARQSDALRGRLGDLQGQLFADISARCQTTTPTADALWGALQFGDRLARHAEGPDGADGDPSMPPPHSLEGAALALETQLETALAAMSVPGRRAWLRARTPALMDAAADTLSESTTWSMGAQAVALGRIHHRLQWFTQQLTRVEVPLEERLSLVESRLHDEWLEATVQYRLEQRVGAWGRRRLDDVSLGLIIAALTLVAYQGLVPMDGAAYVWLVVADTAICAAFFAEFITKYRLAPDRKRYLRRHWFNELLPALPVGLVAFALAGPGLASQSPLLRILKLPAVLARKAAVVLRMLLLLSRGLDRLVRRMGPLLNRDIVFFEPPDTTPQQADLLQRIAATGRRIQFRIEQERGALGRRARRDHLAGQLWVLERRAETLQGGILQQRWLEALPEALAPWGGGSDTVEHLNRRTLRVETAIDRLVNAEPEVIQWELEPALLNQLERLSWLAGLVPLRYIPPLRDLWLARREVGSRDRKSRLAAAFARRLGLKLQQVNEVLMSLADLHGVITAPQFIDRLGALLVNTMQRPAVRLLMLGGSFLALSLLLQVLHIPWVAWLLTWLRDSLGIPILLFGAVAWGLVLVGRWLQRIAATTTEFYLRVAEAQFLSLTKEVKRQRAPVDLALLHQRILVPEARVRGLEPPPTPTVEASPRLTLEALLRQAFACAATFSDADSLVERLQLLYRNYLDGPPLHRHNTHTSDQLLGNLYLQDLMRNVLKLERRDIKALEAMDLRRQGDIIGPALWFNFTALAIAQRTGKLIDDYNRHVLPLEELARAPEDSPERRRHDGWLVQKRGGGKAPSTADTPTTYATTRFTALDFLSPTPERVKALEDHFGVEVRRLVALDRRRMIRAVFGTLPLGNRTLAERSFNPYALYWRYLGGGRIFLLPVTMAWAAARGGGL